MKPALLKKLPFFREEGKKRKEKEKEETSLEKVFRKLDESREAMKKKGEEVRSIIMGIGNDMKGDDGVGWYATDRLKKCIGGEGNVHFIKTCVPENHISEVINFAPHILIILDAADFKGSPGEVRLLWKGQMSHEIGGTHTSTLALFIRLLTEQAESLAGKIVLIGIQYKQAEFGMPMSREVKRSADRLVGLIEKLYKHKLLEKDIDKEIDYLTTRNPIKHFSRVLDKVAEAGRGEKGKSTS